MRRNAKPQQQIYTPGSGPLRKTNNNGPDECEERKSMEKKTRKPEQIFYDPKLIAQNRENHHHHHHNNGNPRRYSNSRRRGDDNNVYYDGDDGWRHQNRRLGSEPRIFTNQTMKTRNHDTTKFKEKPHGKPPSGRRHSTIGLEAHKRNIDQLPPRLQRKYLEENNLINQSVVEENWDYGTTSTFYNSSQMNNCYSTLPGRGRGRLHRDYEHEKRCYRSLTPDMRSPCDSRASTPRPIDKILEDTRILTPTPPAPLHETDRILDWSEEVELNDRLEAEALSNAPTRSSSYASLVETQKVQPPTSTAQPSHSHRRGGRPRRSRRRSGGGGGSTATTRDSSVDNVPRQADRGGSRRRRQSREHSHERFRAFERRRRASNSMTSTTSTTTNEPEDWREEIIRSRQSNEILRQSSEPPITRPTEVRKGGVLVLPPQQKPQQKSLFDPNNPARPIIVKSASTRVNVPGFSNNSTDASPPPLTTTDQFGNVRPGWYDEGSDGYNQCRHSGVIREIKRADNELQMIINEGHVLIRWPIVERLRSILKERLEYLLCNDMKFCQSENVEQHLWKILYHNIIEITRKTIAIDQKNKEQYKGFLHYLLDDGTTYFEHLLERLEEIYKFRVKDYLNMNGYQPKGEGYIGLALISTQKLYLFLGDLTRYKEQLNDSPDYRKCRLWYVKANEINPKNGKPYNQLALLAFYARRKLDAVYYYMRSLMSSNPFPSARESLISLFEENKKKYLQQINYEQGERKRREERQERLRQHMKEKESENFGNTTTNGLRRETWIRPDGGRRIHITTQAALQNEQDSEEEDLARLTSVEVNKRFLTSYLHVHGKLITRIGMESFQEAGIQMLKEFRALLQHSPLPLSCTRFLQLLALNMFAIESTQLKDPELKSQTGYRSEVQERALVISLQMFNLILERCVSILREHLDGSHGKIDGLPQDVHVIMPAVKIWCDWMLCHRVVWNPPPSTLEFRVGTTGDAWTRLAHFINLLEQYDLDSFSKLESDQRGEDYEQVHLPENGFLCGFTPLMVNEEEPKYVRKDVDMEMAQFVYRLDRLLFFGTVFLCGLEPPVLKLEIEDDFREYVSVVCTSNSRDSPPSPQELVHNQDVILESFSEDEGDEENQIEKRLDEREIDDDTRHLLTRKIELERKQQRQQLHMQKVKKILSQSTVSVHIEVRPKYLVPDTNCFIDHLPCIIDIARTHVYTLMIPIVVLSELEGLSRGGTSPTPIPPRRSQDPQHVRRVAHAAKTALDYLKTRPPQPAVKCVTTKGAVLASMTFTTEDDHQLVPMKNDDKILATCLVLNRLHTKLSQDDGENVGIKEDVVVVMVEPKRVVSEVVLLTDDRNLRVKAYARDVPVRELPDFVRWAGLG